MNADPILFYLPAADHPPFDRVPAPDASATPPGLFLSPAVNWIWRTHHHLASTGFPCRLVETMPDCGIVVAAACNLPLLFRPNPRLFVVSCVADSPPRFYPQAHVFQSATQARVTGCRRPTDTFPLCEFIPHWPQPDLLPRDKNRGDTFANIDYFGARDQLAPAFQEPAFFETLRKHGLNLRLHFEFYHDYRETDAVLAVRDTNLVSHKPASKLINAWRAGAPAMLGPESAFRELRASDSDFIEIASPRAALEACLRLRDDIALRRRMTENGRTRAAEFSEDVITRKWASLLESQIRPAAARWFASATAARSAFLFRQSLRRVRQSLARRLRPGPP